MISCVLGGIGLRAPGLDGWNDSLPILRGEAPYTARPMPPAKPLLLPASERRRAPGVARLALQVAEEAVAQAGLDPGQVRSVFASSGGDLSIIDKLCQSLQEPGRPVSPTQFHNSVHNAPAGYWSIASRSHLASLSLSAYDDTFISGLLEALTLLESEDAPVLLVAYDCPAPEPLADKRPISAPFAVALLLTPGAPAKHFARLEIAPGGNAAETRLDDAGLETLRCSNPAARSLPLLAAIVCGSTAEIVFATATGAITLSVRP